MPRCLAAATVGTGGRRGGVLEKGHRAVADDTKWRRERRRKRRLERVESAGEMETELLGREEGQQTHFQVHIINPLAYIYIIYTLFLYTARVLHNI